MRVRLKHLHLARKQRSSRTIFSLRSFLIASRALLYRVAEKMSSNFCFCRIGARGECTSGERTCVNAYVRTYVRTDGCTHAQADGRTKTRQTDWPGARRAHVAPGLCSLLAASWLPPDARRSRSPGSLLRSPCAAARPYRYRRSAG
jgi:hypothetical protein